MWCEPVFAEDTIMAKNATPSQAIALLIEAAKTDTIHRDVYLRRARELLSPMLDEASYRALRSTQKDIDEVVRRTRSAVLQHNWPEARELAAQAEQMRRYSQAMADVAGLARDVYDADPIAFDPFSPGKHLGQQAQAVQGELRAQFLATLGSLAKQDTGLGAFYEKRRGYFSGLQIAGAATLEKSSKRSRAQLEQLVLEAAERGDSAAVQSLAKELEHHEDEDGKDSLQSDDSTKSRYACPVSLESPFPTEASARAREIGLVETHVPALPEVSAAVEVIYTHAWDPVTTTPELEHEGVLRTEVLAESQVPAQFVTEEYKVLAGQFIQQIFINSGGARYLPRISAETALVEDFPENETVDRPAKLLAALRLPQRRALARAEIENALMCFGAQILAEQLNLDPIEFRLVCIPYDLYMRLGRDRGWGQWHHWTHFDGYQVVRDNRLRALVGGDGRFGGVADVVSISRTDAHDRVYARFAVVRRARMVARWR
jgi:hypothetical protein